MSKVIRTGQVASSGGIVTLGRAEEGLFYDPEVDAASDGKQIDLPAMIEARLNDVRGELDGQWEKRLREEHETTRTAGERQLAEAQQQHSQELERTSQERYDEGYQDGAASNEAEATQAVDRMTVLHDALKAERTQVLLDAESVVVDLALSLARRVVRVEPSADPLVVARTAREALRRVSERSNLMLKVHPEDLSIARRFAAAWVERVDADAILRVQTSAHVDRGGCMVEGPEENVDARLITQLETLHEALRDGVMSQHHNEASAGENEDLVTADVTAPPAESSEVDPTAGPEDGDDGGDES